MTKTSPFWPVATRQKRSVGLENRNSSLVTRSVARSSGSILGGDSDDNLRRGDSEAVYENRFQLCISSVSSPPNLMDSNAFIDEKAESRLYVGNLDLRVTEATLIKMFSPFGKIEAEDFLWHTRGSKRGVPRGFAFVQYSSKEEAKLAKEKMHGKLACGRPLIVRLASEKYLTDAVEASSSKAEGQAKKAAAALSSGQMSKSAKIAAIKNKLKSLEEAGSSAKKLEPS